MKYFTLMLLLLMSKPIFAQTFSPLPVGTISSLQVTSPAPTLNSLETNNTAPTEGIGGYVLDDKYKLSAGVRISIQILEYRDPAKSLLITDSGKLECPY